MKNTITEIRNTLGGGEKEKKKKKKKKRNTLEGTNSRITEAEEWISELEDTIVEITAEEQNKGKGMKRIEESLKDL